MPKRIEEDHKDFRDVINGRLRQSLRKHIKNGKIFKNRGKNGKISINVPSIDQPYIVYGDNSTGVGRDSGNGQPGDVLGTDPGSKKGNQAGDESGEGTTIQVDLEEVLEFMQDELKLPDMQPKQQGQQEDKRIRYTSLSLVGPPSLRHMKKTMLNALKRSIANGSAKELHYVPGIADPVPLIVPEKGDVRYRQWKEYNIPDSNALIVFARDGSGSMDQEKCDVVSDMCWWISCWIKRFYKKVDSCYIWHDTVAEEVNEEKFYNYRYGGGTICSSAFKKMLELFENTYPPNKFNIYVFYFTDGENFGNDNDVLVELLSKEFTKDKVNMVGVTQIFASAYADSVVKSLDTAVSDGTLSNTNIKSVLIQNNLSTTTEMQVLEAIQKLLGAKKS